MRKTWLLAFVLVIVGVCGSTAFALDPMGPPAARLRQGQWGLGLDYAHGPMDIPLSAGTWTDYLNGAFNASGQAASVTISDFATDRAYAGLVYGLSDSWEAFLRLGAVNSSFGDSIVKQGEEFEGDIDFVGGAGIKATFYEQFYWKIGAILQGSWAQYDGTLEAPLWPAADYVQIDLAQVQAAVGITWMKSDNISIYGGPFAYFLMGDFELRSAEAVGGGILSTEFLWDIDEGPIYGAYFGVQVKVFEHHRLSAECQLTADSYALGASLMLRQ